jgi:hypothetical protein
MTEAYKGLQQLSSASSDLNAVSFIVRMILGELATATVVQVVAVTPGGGALAPTGTVDVLPLVNQIDGRGDATPHATVYGLPFMRLQGGANAVIIDPVVGDIGLAVFASRDISSVKANRAQANPGTRRQFDYADGLYVGGFLNGTPTQYVRFTTAGVEIVSPTAVTLTAPTITLDGAVHQTGAVTGDTTAVYQGQVTANAGSTAIPLAGHKHTGVTTGGGTSGGTVP